MALPESLQAVTLVSYLPILIAPLLLHAAYQNCELEAICYLLMRNWKIAQHAENQIYAAADLAK